APSPALYVQFRFCLNNITSKLGRVSSSPLDMTRFRWIHPPFHSLHPTFGSLLLPQGAFSGPCCSQWGWSPLLRSTGSGGTCIPPGISAFLLQAFTAHYRNSIHVQRADNPSPTHISGRFYILLPSCRRLWHT